MIQKIKEVSVADIIAGTARTNDIIAYLYSNLKNVELFKDCHGYFYRNGKSRVYVKYAELRAALKGTYIRVSENGFEKVK